MGESTRKASVKKEEHRSFVYTHTVRWQNNAHGAPYINPPCRKAESRVVSSRLVHPLNLDFNDCPCMKNENERSKIDPTFRHCLVPGHCDRLNSRRSPDNRNSNHHCLCDGIVVSLFFFPKIRIRRKPTQVGLELFFFTVHRHTHHEPMSTAPGRGP